MSKQMSLRNVTPKEWAVVILGFSVTLFDALVQAGGTPAVISIYLVDAGNQKVGLWATSVLENGDWRQVSSESSSSAGGTIHDVLIARYFLFVASAFWVALTMASLYWALAPNHMFGNPSYVSLLKPVGFVSLMMRAATALTVTTLLRTLEKGTVPGMSVSGGGRTSEALLWLGFGLTFLVLLMVLRTELFGRLPTTRRRGGMKPPMAGPPPQ